MSVRASWHAPLSVAEERDPFIVRIEDVGTPVRLSAAGEEADLNRRLLATVDAESRLDDEGVTCAIKDSADSSCHACPVKRTDDSPLAKLCAIGHEQERLCTEILARRHGGRR